MKTKAEHDQILAAFDANIAAVLATIASLLGRRALLAQPCRASPHIIRWTRKSSCAAGVPRRLAQRAVTGVGAVMHCGRSRQQRAGARDRKRCAPAAKYG